MNPEKKPEASTPFLTPEEMRRYQPVPPGTTPTPTPPPPTTTTIITTTTPPQPGPPLVPITGVQPRPEPPYIPLQSGIFRNATNPALQKAIEDIMKEKEIKKMEEEKRKEKEKTTPSQPITTTTTITPPPSNFTFTNPLSSTDFTSSVKSLFPGATGKEALFTDYIKKKSTTQPKPSSRPALVENYMKGIPRIENAVLGGYTPPYDISRKKLLRFGGDRYDESGFPTRDPYHASEIIPGRAYPNIPPPLPGASTVYSVGQKMTPIDADKMSVSFVLDEKERNGWVKSYIEEMMRDDTLTSEERGALSFLYQKVLAPGALSDAEKDFWLDFMWWLIGEPRKEVDFINTPWLRDKGVPDPVINIPEEHVNLAFWHSDIAKFINAFKDLRTKFVSQVDELKIRPPGNLGEAYLYYKYVVRNDQSGDWLSDADEIGKEIVEKKKKPFIDFRGLEYKGGSLSPDEEQKSNRIRDLNNQLAREQNKNADLQSSLNNNTRAIEELKSKLTETQQGLGTLSPTSKRFDDTYKGMTDMISQLNRDLGELVVNRNKLKTELTTSDETIRKYMTTRAGELEDMKKYNAELVKYLESNSETIRNIINKLAAEVERVSKIPDKGEYYTSFKKIEDEIKESFKNLVKSVPNSSEGVNTVVDTYKKFVDEVVESIKKSSAETAQQIASVKTALAGPLTITDESGNIRGVNLSDIYKMGGNVSEYTKRLDEMSNLLKEKLTSQEQLDYIVKNLKTIVENERETDERTRSEKNNLVLSNIFQKLNEIAEKSPPQIIIQQPEQPPTVPQVGAPPPPPPPPPVTTAEMGTSTEPLPAQPPPPTGPTPENIAELKKGIVETLAPDFINKVSQIIEERQKERTVYQVNVDVPDSIVKAFGEIQSAIAGISYERGFEVSKLRKELESANKRIEELTRDVSTLNNDANKVAANKTLKTEEKKTEVLDNMEHIREIINESIGGKKPTTRRKKQREEQNKPPEQPEVAPQPAPEQPPPPPPPQPEVVQPETTTPPAPAPPPQPEAPPQAQPQPPQPVAPPPQPEPTQELQAMPTGAEFINTQAQLLGTEVNNYVDPRNDPSTTIFKVDERCQSFIKELNKNSALIASQVSEQQLATLNNVLESLESKVSQKPTHVTVNHLDIQSLNNVREQISVLLNNVYQANISSISDVKRIYSEYQGTIATISNSLGAIGSTYQSVSSNISSIINSLNGIKTDMSMITSNNIKESTIAELNKNISTLTSAVQGLYNKNIPEIGGATQATTTTPVVSNVLPDLTDLNNSLNNMLGQNIEVVYDANGVPTIAMGQIGINTDKDMFVDRVVKIANKVLEHVVVRPVYSTLTEMRNDYRQYQNIIQQWKDQNIDVEKLQDRIIETLQKGMPLSKEDLTSYINAANNMMTVSGKFQAEKAEYTNTLNTLLASQTVTTNEGTKMSLNQFITSNIDTLNVNQKSLITTFNKIGEEARIANTQLAKMIEKRDNEYKSRVLDTDRILDNYINKNKDNLGESIKKMYDDIKKKEYESLIDSIEKGTLPVSKSNDIVRSLMLGLNDMDKFNINMNDKQVQLINNTVNTLENKIKESNDKIAALTTKLAEYDNTIKDAIMKNKITSDTSTNTKSTEEVQKQVKVSIINEVNKPQTSEIGVMTEEHGEGYINPFIRRNIEGPVEFRGMSGLPQGKIPEKRFQTYKEGDKNIYNYYVPPRVFFTEVVPLMGPHFYAHAVDTLPMSFWKDFYDLLVKEGRIKGGPDDIKRDTQVFFDEFDKEYKKRGGGGGGGGAVPAKIVEEEPEPPGKARRLNIKYVDEGAKLQESIEGTITKTENVGKTIEETSKTVSAGDKQKIEIIKGVGETIKEELPRKQQSKQQSSSKEIEEYKKRSDIYNKSIQKLYDDYQNKIIEIQKKFNDLNKIASDNSRTAYERSEAEKKLANLEDETRDYIEQSNKQVMDVIGTMPGGQTKLRELQREQERMSEVPLNQ